MSLLLLFEDLRVLGVLRLDSRYRGSLECVPKEARLTIVEQTLIDLHSAVHVHEFGQEGVRVVVQDA